MKTMECKGYGFVLYSTEEEAKNAMEGLSRLGYQVSIAREGYDPKKASKSHPMTTGYVPYGYGPTPCKFIKM